MALARWFDNSSDPFREMERLLGAFRHSGLQRSNVYPALNVYDDGEGLIVRAEMPGVDAKSLDVTVEGDTLTLRGERKAPSAERASFHRRERDFGRFHRALTLPEPVESQKVVATYNDGVLEVRLPRAESAKPRKIAVRAS